MTGPTGASPPIKGRASYAFGRSLARERGNFTWVYLWGAPLRAMHWIAAFSIVVLIVTGFYVGRPYITTTGEASAHFLMGRMRFRKLAPRNDRDAIRQFKNLIKVLADHNHR